MNRSRGARLPLCASMPGLVIDFLVVRGALHTFISTVIHCTMGSVRYLCCLQVFRSREESSKKEQLFFR